MPYHLEINKVSNFGGALHHGTVPKVSAGTVHGSTARCCREMSPQTPTDNVAVQAITHSREKYVRTVGIWNAKVGGEFDNSVPFHA